MEPRRCSSFPLRRWANRLLVLFALLAALVASGAAPAASSPDTAVNWTCRTNCLVIQPLS